MVVYDDNRGITLGQLGKMCHCIGFERNKIKRNKYSAYRNYYTTGENGDSDFESLVGRGLAKKEKFNKRRFVYFLNAQGLKLIADIFQCDIKELD